MKGEELVAIRIGLKLEPQEFADILATGLRQYQKWESGEAPIRPVIARSILNAEKLIKLESKVRKIKVLELKNEAYQKAIDTCIKGLSALGADEKLVEDMHLLVAQNKAPSVENISRLFDSIDNPVEQKDLISGLLGSLLQEIKHNSRCDADDVSRFVSVLEGMSESQVSTMRRWSSQNVVQTCPDALVSLQRAIRKDLYS
ncbi:DUF1870 family protein [Pseudomonas luteola]